jgi:hypothetical protein
MKIQTAVARSVSALALAAFSAFFSIGPANAEPVYNPAMPAVVSGVVSAVSEVPAGQPLEGVHVMVKTKTGNVEVYLAPRNFLSFLKVNIAVGDFIEVTGSEVKSGNADVVLAREVDDGRASITLRDSFGAEVWKHWGAATVKAS